MASTTKPHYRLHVCAIYGAWCVEDVRRARRPSWYVASVLAVRQAQEQEGRFPAEWRGNDL